LAQPVDPLVAQQGGFDTPVAALPATKLTKKKKVEPEPEPEPTGFLAKMWNEKRALSLAAIAATALMLVGGIGAAGYLLAQPSATGGDNGNAVAEKNRNGKKPATLATSTTAKTDSTPASKRRKEFKLEKLAAGDGLLSAARTDDALDPEATKRKFEEMYAKRNDAGDQPAGPDIAAQTKAARRAARRKAAREKEAASVTAAPPAEVKPVTEKPEETKTVAAAKSPAEEPKAIATAMAKPAVKPVEKKTPSAPKGNPFAGLPETVDLPASTETGDVKIADVTIDKRYLMGLELLTGPEVCKYKFVFDLKRSASDKQLWDIRMQRRKRDDPLPVAQIQKTPTELKFRWLPAAEEFDDANYIRNCKIKLSAAKDIGWIGFRKPVDIQDFASNLAEPL
jgi:hypothetical protein